MPTDRRNRITLTLQRRVGNPITKLSPFQTLLETTGRKSGQPRRTALGGRRVGNEFWLVSEFGTGSQYIKNIQADPTVRVRLRGKWHTGTAHLLPDDDAAARLKALPTVNSFGVKTFGTNLLTVRIDLD
ncbi:nitroreductase/quinone reductase family protein [Nocardia sp. 348MFTsu5.1]|uniref:nitroreductase/quinone reductase family protein n=1 Tax=Nocardia sp. 348MFTsu5.1 TaxID=1172185 RepID=UPI00055C2121|nr:nitroreductase/quinone reductase family protein [Nocardia sp. 348MFTsu5.1]